MAMMFYYAVIFVPEDEDMYENHIEHGTVTEHGMIAAKNYGKAVNRLVSYYGQSNICEISIYELGNPISMEEIQEFDKF